MAEPQQKRLRSEEAHHDEYEEDSNSISKRQKPYGNILSLLDGDDEDHESSHELSAIFTTLQQEISSADAFDFDSSPFAAAEDSKSGGGDEDEGVRSVMRHLLEASDDELGIPNPEELCNRSSDFGGIRSDEGFDFSAVVDNGIWELEDVAANYYAILQSELELINSGWGLVRR